MESIASRNNYNAVSPFSPRQLHKLVLRLVPLMTFVLLVALSGRPALGQSVCVQPPSGAVAWWSFDETSGTMAADRIGNNPGAWNNAPVPAAGEVRGALRFNGTNYVIVQDSNLWAFGANDFTIE